MIRLFQFRYCLFLLGFNLLVTQTAVAAEKVRVMGAGPSTQVVSLLFDQFSQQSAAQGYTFEVEQRSIKHAGGIKASDHQVFGRTGRPLNHKEKALNKQEIFVARIPLAMVTGKNTGVKSISLQQLEKIMTGKISNWKQLGGVDHDIILVGRESTEAAFSVLKKQYPFFNKAQFKKIFKRDHQVVNFLTTESGNYALSFGAQSNFEAGHVLNVTGFEAGVSVGLVYDRSNKNHPLVKAVAKYVRSEQWKKLVKQHDYLPPGLN